MSNLTVKGNASGTGTVTIEAPNTNTNRTITLPDATGTVLAAPAGSVTINSSAPSNSLTVDGSGNLLVGTAIAQSSAANRGNITVGGSAGSIVNLASASSRLGYIFHDGTNMQINNNVGGYLNFNTSDTERARITPSGQFLVGRTSPRVNEFASITGSPDSGQWMLECVNTRSTAALNGILLFYPNAGPNNTTNQFLQCVDGLSVTRAEIRSNGGLANFSANNVNISDERTKTDIAPLGSYWDKIKALQVVTYKYLDQTHADDNIGVIAQQVESVAPELVSNDGFGETPADGVPLKSIYEADLHYAALKALQEAMARIEELTARVAELEAN